MRVDFYLLAETTTDTALLFACRLLEKAYLQQQTVFVCCPSPAVAENLDNLLWTFKDVGFIPHQLIQDKNYSQKAPIQIGVQEKPAALESNILLNLSNNIPVFAFDYKRVLELVLNEPAAKQAGRERYREYRTRACTLHTHNFLTTEA